MSIFEEKLRIRRQENNFRELKIFSDEFIDFQSNDYLGFSRNKEIHEIWYKENLEFHHNGATGSRLISGNSNYYTDIEEYLSKYYTSENTIIFPSGYMANLAVFSTIPQKNDVVLYDELCHASIRDGLRLSFAKSYSFKHNDFIDLEEKLQKHNSNIYVVAEGLYSMDGDFPDVYNLEALMKKYHFKLILDEAHSTGILGENGKGLYENFKEGIFLRIHTFGKAMGIHGAVVCCKNDVKDFLVNFSRPLIYSTAMCFSELSRIKIVHEYYKIKGLKLKEKLAENIKYFNSKWEAKSFLQSPIQLYFNENIHEIETKLLQKKIAAKAIKSPTVASGTERIRICLHTYNSFEEIDVLVSILNEFE